MVNFNEFICRQVKTFPKRKRATQSVRTQAQENSCPTPRDDSKQYVNSRYHCPEHHAATHSCERRDYTPLASTQPIVQFTRGYFLARSFTIYFSVYSTNKCLKRLKKIHVLLRICTVCVCLMFL